MSTRVRVRPAEAPDGNSPAIGERLGMGFLLGGMGLGLSAQFALAWAWARPVSGPPAVALGGGILLAALARTLGSVAREDGGADNEIAWIGLLLGGGVAIAFMRIGPQAAVPALLAAASVWSVWWLTGYVWRNLLMAVPAVRETGAGPMRDAHGQVVGSGSVDIAANVQAGAFGGVLAGAAVALLGLQLRHGRLGPPVEIGAVAMALQCACACLLVAQGQRRALLREARLYQARVLPGFSAGYAAGAVAATVVLTALALILPSYPSLITLHGVGRGVAHSVGSVVGHTKAPGAVAPQRATRAPQGTATTGGGSPVGGALGGLGGILTFAGIAVIVVVLFFGMRLAWTAVRSNFGRRISIAEFLTTLWQTLLALLEMLFSGGGLLGLWTALMRARAEGREAAGHQPAAAPRAPLLQRLTDPRLRVRAAYRHMLAGVRGKGHRRPFWYSPGRFRRQLEGALAANRGDLSRLTGLYEEARYSAHGMADGSARAAETAAEAVVRQARAVRTEPEG